MTRLDPNLAASIAVTRFGLGARPGEIAEAVSDPQGWLLGQIRPSGADQPEGDLASTSAALELFREARERRQAMKAAEAAADAARAAPSADPAMAAPASGVSQAAGRDPAAAKAPGDALAGGDKRAEAEAAREPVRLAVAGDMLARTRLAALTPAGFRERWTLFWANHFTVSSRKFATSALPGPFEREAIRPHVFGRFEELLLASSRHPAMLLYLDQAASIGPDSLAGLRRKAGLNENLGREILELHTVGADAGYTQADVTEFARALTGWSVARPGEGRGEGAYLWRPAIHEPGARTVMGRTYPDEGEAQAVRILADLARDPRTAARIARKIATHFVADDPPPALVARMKASYLSSEGDLGEVARALVLAPEAWAPAQAKFKTPNEFVVSAWRAAGDAPRTPPEAVQPLTQLGQRPFTAPQPNGWSEEAGDWASGSALVRRLAWASAFAARHAPDEPPLAAAEAALGARTSPELRASLARLDARPQAFALLLMAPEFQRR